MKEEKQAAHCKKQIFEAICLTVGMLDAGTLLILLIGFHIPITQVIVDLNDQSIEGQVRDCYRYAKDHDITIIEEYLDRHISGKEAEKRQAFQQMISVRNSSLRTLKSIVY